MISQPSARMPGPMLQALRLGVFMAACQWAGAASLPASAPTPDPISAPLPTPMPAPMPAHLLPPEPACAAQLQQAMEQLAGNTVTLDLTQWQNSTEILLERRVMRDTRGRQRDGREMRGPLRLQLQIAQGQCQMALAGKAPAPLTSCTCVAATAKK